MGLKQISLQICFHPQGCRFIAPLLIISTVATRREISRVHPRLRPRLRGPNTLRIAASRLGPPRDATVDSDWSSLSSSLRGSTEDKPCVFPIRDNAGCPCTRIDVGPVDCGLRIAVVLRSWTTATTNEGSNAHVIHVCICCSRTIMKTSLTPTANKTIEQLTLARSMVTCEWTKPSFSRFNVIALTSLLCSDLERLTKFGLPTRGYVLEHPNALPSPRFAAGEVIR